MKKQYYGSLNFDIRTDNKNSWKVFKLIFSDKTITELEFDYWQLISKTYLDPVKHLSWSFL